MQCRESNEQFMQEVWEYSYDQFEVNLGNFLRIYKKSYCFHIVYKSRNLVELIGIRIEEAPNGETESQTGLEDLLKELEQNFHFQATYKIVQEYDSIFGITKLQERIWEQKEDETIQTQYLMEQKKMVMSNITMGNIVTAQKLFHNILMEMSLMSSVKRNNIVIDIMSTKRR